MKVKWIETAKELPPLTESIVIEEDGREVKYSKLVWITLEDGHVTIAEIGEDGEWCTWEGAPIENEVIAWCEFIKPEPYTK